MISSTQPNLNHPSASSGRNPSKADSSDQNQSKSGPREDHKPKAKSKKNAFKTIQLPKAPDLKQYQDKISTELKKFSESHPIDKEKIKKQSFAAAKQGEKVVKSLFSLAMLFPNIASIGTNINVLHITALLGGIYAAYQWQRHKSEHHWKDIQSAAITAEQSAAKATSLASDVIMQTQAVEQTQAKLRDRLSKPKYISTMGTNGSITYTFIDSKPLFLVSDTNAEQGFTEACKHLADSKKALSLANRQLNTDYSTFRSTMAKYGKDRWWRKHQKNESNKVVNILSASIGDDDALHRVSTQNLNELQNIVIASIDKEAKRYQGLYNKRITAQLSELKHHITPQSQNPPPAFFAPPSPPKAPAPEKKADDKKADDKKVDNPKPDDKKKQS